MQVRMGRLAPRLAAWAAALALAGPAAAQTPAQTPSPVAPSTPEAYAALRAVEAPQEAAALDAAVADLCRARIVLLGENGAHGDGRTPAFKAELVRRLVDDCGFDAVAFEASRYDFLALDRALRRGEPATADMLASAVGGLWNQNREVQPLFPFLIERAAAGRIVLAGLDDQLGSRGAFYSLERMPAELAARLPAPRDADCRDRLMRRIWSRYDVQTPYDDAARAGLRACLAEIGAAAADDAELRDMTANVVRWLDREGLALNPFVQGRDRSMFLNLKALVESLPDDARVVVWTANSHAARDARALDIFSDGPNLGALAAGEWGDRLFALGFGAAGGTYRERVRTPKAIAPAAPGALEARALADPAVQVAYLGPAALAALPSIEGGALDHRQPATVDWRDVYDGVVVFRAERPPLRLDE
jgi:erythromycin esterase-like protein